LICRTFARTVAGLTLTALGISLTTPTAEASRRYPTEVALRYPIAPNIDHSPVVQTPFKRCRTALADPNGVLVIGDSITALGFENITAQFAAAGRPVCINARDGRRTDEGVYQLSRFVSGGLVGPNTSVVMALGSNDVLRPASEMKTNIVRTMQLLGTQRNVYWVHAFNYLWWDTVPQWRYVRGTRRVGEEIKWGAAHYGNLTTVPWPTLVKATYPALLSQDLLHPTPDGNAARTRLILETMKPTVAP